MTPEQQEVIDYRHFVFTCTFITYGITLTGMLLSCYLFGLITFKSPASLHAYRYFLQLQTIWDAAAAFWIGFVAMPQGSCPEGPIKDIAGGFEPGDKLMLISVRGLAATWGQAYGPIIAYSTLPALLICINITLLYSLLYRYAMLKDCDYKESFLKWRGLAVYWGGLLAAFCFVYSMTSRMFSDLVELTHDNANLSGILHGTDRES